MCNPIPKLDQVFQHLPARCQCLDELRSNVQGLHEAFSLHESKATLTDRPNQEIQRGRNTVDTQFLECARTNRTFIRSNDVPSRDRQSEHFGFSAILEGWPSVEPHQGILFSGVAQVNRLDHDRAGCYGGLKDTESRLLQDLAKRSLRHRHVMQAELAYDIQRPCTSECDGEARVNDNRATVQPLPRLGSCAQDGHLRFHVEFFPKLMHKISEGDHVRATEVRGPPSRD